MFDVTENEYGFDVLHNGKIISAVQVSYGGFTVWYDDGGEDYTEINYKSEYYNYQLVGNKLALLGVYSGYDYDLSKGETIGFYF